MASRFWVGGTGTWDSSTTTHWAASTGGAGGQSVPGVNDAVTFDGSSGGGTVTVNTTVSVQSITCGAFTGTLDFSANNNNVTLSAAAGMSGTGSGVRTINLGNGTWTLSSTTIGSTLWNFSTTTNLTFAANSSIIKFTGAIALGVRTFAGGGLTYNKFWVTADSSGGTTQITGANTFSTLQIDGQNAVQFPTATTQTVTTLTVAGAAGSENYLFCSSLSNRATISVASGTVDLPWSATANMAFTGGATFTATFSFDLGGNTGITISAPPSTIGRLVSCQRGSPY